MSAETTTSFPVLKRGDAVQTRMYGDAIPGLVIRVAKDGSWADVFWGAWSKRMPTTGLYKPKEVFVPGLSGNGVTATLLQFDGEASETVR